MSFRVFLVSSIIVFGVFPLRGQKRALNSITRHDLEMHMEFLASDELQGRNTGEPGLQIAARYLEVQAKQLGLKPMNGTDGFFQYYTIEEKSYDRNNSAIIIERDSAVQVNKEAFYVFPSVEGDGLDLTGEAVFAGYGIMDQDHSYNDFEKIDLAGKVVLIMNRAPMNEDGTKALFDDEKWTGMQNMQYKLPYIMTQDPKAVILVFDPKSGMNSIEDMGTGIAQYLSSSRTLKSDVQDNPVHGSSLKVIMIHRSVADQILGNTGKTLSELQNEIDRNISPQSFEIENTRIHIQARMKVQDINVSNVFGIIEGSDPKRRDEVVVYLAHYDHVGTDGQGGVFNGADDNASGTVALIEIAEAFMKEKKAPARSIGFLWVSAEEIGLFGSRYFANHSLVPEGKTVAVINLDMVGRTKNQADLESARPGLTIQGGDTVKVIGGKQSKVLMDINERTLKKMDLVGNYEFNRLDHPERYFYRSDHISFARRDIPVLSYSTGTHKDYHLVTDEEELIDYNKFVKMTRFAFMVGYNAAQYASPIEVDNPMSSW